jgi:hypothetical protein
MNNLSQAITRAFGAASEQAKEVEQIRQKLGESAPLLDKIIQDLVRHRGFIEAITSRTREVEDLAYTQKDALATAATVTHPGNSYLFMAKELNEVGNAELEQIFEYVTAARKRKIWELLSNSPQ